MDVGQARDIARAWVAERAHGAPAFFHGSAIELPDNAALRPWSDIDVAVVGDAPAGETAGKRSYGGALLDIAYVPRARVSDADTVLAAYHLATSFRRDGIIADPDGWLRTLQAEVAPRFAEARWVRARCNDAIANVRRHAARCMHAETVEDAAIGALFACGVLAHVVLVAALRNPTVRTRYAAAREAMLDHGLTVEYEALLEVAGYASLSADIVRAALDTMARSFDAALAAGAADVAAGISADSRPVAVDGSRDLIERGLHREAMYWIAVTWARCTTLLRGATTGGVHASIGHDVLGDIGIASIADARWRAESAIAHIPAVEALAARIIESRE